MNRQKDKNAIRKEILLYRSKLSKEDQINKSELMTKHILASDAFLSSQHIGLYYAVNGEVDAGSLTALDKSKQYYLPIVSNTPDQALSFAPISHTSQYKANKYSIPEPIYKEEELISGDKLDLVIMPLVAFDRHGNRLGMGGGYYDRTFSFKQGSIKKPTLLGIAYDFQKLESLAPEPWDIPLDMLATESKLIVF